MGDWEELNDFSCCEGTFPCALCKEDSVKTVLGNHWKCVKCDHIFNPDKSELKIECHCEKCIEKQAALAGPTMSLTDAFKALKNSHRKATAKKKRKTKGKHVDFAGKDTLPYSC
jgi:hypothetical protein